jgi:hypothetical protein
LCEMTKSIEWFRDGDCIRTASHASNNEGYPLLQRDHKQMPLARWILSRRFTRRGLKLTTGIHSRHTCDNRWCINPLHIIHGSNNDNVQDRVSRNRSARLIGEAHGRVKLSEANVAYILSSPNSQSVLASMFGVSKSCIKHIKRRRNWRHVNYSDAIS